MDNDTIERLKDHADWLQERADNPNTVAPGSTEPRSIVDSKRLGEIAGDIREAIEQTPGLHSDRFKPNATYEAVKEFWERAYGP